MARPRSLDVLKALVDATRAGEVQWEGTVDENVFRATFHGGAIHVEQIIERGSPGLEFIRVNLLNRKGAVLDEATDQDAELETAAMVQDLFEHARANALKVDESLDELYDSVVKRDQVSGKPLEAFLKGMGLGPPPEKPSDQADREATKKLKAELARLKANLTKKPGGFGG